MRSDLRAVFARTLSAAHVAFAVGAAILLVSVWAAPASLGEWDGATGRLSLDTQHATGLRLATLVGAGLLVLDVLYLLYGRRPRAPLRHVVSEGEGGSVLVAREAIEVGLRAAGEALSAVSRVRISLQQAGLRRLVVHAQFHATEGAVIQTASTALRTALLRQFEALVHLAEGARVEFELEFLGFAGRPPKRGATREEPAPPDPPFTGPRYPIEEDDDAAQA